MIRRDIPPGVAVYDTVPLDPVQFRSRFGRQMTAQDTRDIQALKRNLQGSAFHTATFEAALDRPERFVLLLGHNEGNRIIEGTGRSKSLSEAGNLCYRFVKMCFFIVCNSQSDIGGSGIGLIGKINARRAGLLARDLIDIVNSADVNSDGNLRLPAATVRAMMMRVEREGGTLKLIGYRAADWFVVRLIMVVPNCERGDC